MQATWIFRQKQTQHGMTQICDWERILHRQANKWQTVTLTQHIKQPLTSPNISPEGNILA